MTSHIIGMRRSVLYGLVLVIALPLALTAQSPSGSTLFDGVVIDAAGRTAFVTTPGGTVAAIDLTSGAQKWASAVAARPLAVADDTVVAQASPNADEQLVMVSLDANAGSEKHRSRVALPGGLRADLADSAGQRMQIRGAVASGQVIVSWAIEARFARGAALDDEAVHVNGAARIDPATGATVTLANPATADAGALSNMTVDEMRQMRSADGQHVMRSERSLDPDDPTPYLWRITTADGAPVGVVEGATSLAPFIVSGSQLLHIASPGGRAVDGRLVIAPLRLRAVDLTTGTELWAVPIRDTSAVLPPG